MSEKKLPPRVLIVDDEILQRKIVSQQLLKLGCMSEAVATAADAVELLQAKDFDVVLLDVQMSDLSGLEALPLIKNLEDAPEVVTLTLDKTLESGVAALRAGAYDYLTKPAPLDALEATVSKATEKRRLVRQNKTLKDYVRSKTARTGAALIGPLNNPDAVGPTNNSNDYTNRSVIFGNIQVPPHDSLNFSEPRINRKRDG